jgi:hypothetical protein
MNHIGEMPEQQSADLQILGQLRSQLQLEGEALARAEQQKSYLQSMMTQTAPAVELDEPDQSPAADASGTPGKAPANSAMPSKLASMRARLTALQGRYPEIRKLRQEIADEEAKESTAQTSFTRSTMDASPLVGHDLFALDLQFLDGSGLPILI